MPIATPDRDTGGRKKTSKPKRRAYTLPQSFRTEAPSRRARPKAGPPSPQLTGRPTRPQPRRQDERLPPDRRDDRDRSPAQRARDRAVANRNSREARRRVVARRGRGAGARRAVQALRFGSQAASSGGTPSRRSIGGTVTAGDRAERSSALGLVPTRAIRGVGQAFVQDPVSTTRGTLRGGRDALVGAVPGLVSLAVDPKGTLKRGAADYSRRYGPLTKTGKAGKAGQKAFVERVKKEGAFAEGADASILLGGVAAPASRGVGVLARAGKLGEKAQRIMVEPRRAVRTSGGEAREQAVDPHFFKARRQKRRDERAFQGQQRQVRRADERARAKPAEDGQQRKRGPVDAVVRQATERGEVVPSKLVLTREGKRVGVGRAPSKRKIARAQKRGYAKRKGRVLHEQRAEQRAEGITGGARGAGRNFASLNRAERRAFKTALQSGASSPAAGAEWVRARIAKIEAHREANGTEPTGVDELPVLRKILSDPEAHFTPKLLEVAREENARGRRVAEADPALGDTPAERAQTAELRRRAPQAQVLGSPRRGTPVDRAVREADARVKVGKRAVGKARTRAERARRRLAREEGRASLIVAGARRRLGEERKSPELGAVEATGRKGNGNFAGDADLEATWSALRGKPNATDVRVRETSAGRRVAVHRFDGDGKLVGRLAFDVGEDGVPAHVDVVVHSGARRRGVATEMYDAARRDGFDMRRAAGERSADGRAFRAAYDDGGSGAIGRAQRAVEIHSRAAANHRRREGRARSGKTREAHGKMAEAAEERAAAAQKRLDDLKGAKEATRPEYRPRVRAARGAVTDAQRQLEAAREGVRELGKAAREVRGARRRGARLIDAEPVPDYLRRIDDEARAAGLEDPAFVSSQPRETKRFGVFTVGGPRAAKRDRRYEGKLFAAGTEDGSFQTYAQALARNVKRKHNWNLVADTIEEHALRDSKGNLYRGTPEELERIVEREGFDRGEVGFWNDVVFRERRKAAALDDGGDTVGHVDELGETELHAAAVKAQDTEAFVDSRDFVLMPKPVLDEVMADTRPSGWFGRSVDVVKGKQARILLGTSPAWLQFQIASNMLLTGLAGVGPLEIVRAQRWWRGLSDAEKRAVEPHVGVGHFHDSRDQVKLGAAADNGIVNAWRAFKAHPFWHTPRKPLRGAAVSQLNPLDALFRVDNAQNNLFRRAVLYNRVKRDAYARMGQNVSLMQRAQDRVIGHLSGLSGETEKAMAAILADRKALEVHARAVNDFLGDYMTYTAKERRLLGRSVMFYGFMRFSLRFAFYTMPVRHPVMTAMLAQLGRMQTEEVRRLLGGDELPWALGRFYFTKGGKLKSIDVSRANPFLNQVTQMQFDKGARGALLSALRVLPPMYVTLANIAFGKSSFDDKPYATGGRTRQKTEQEGITSGQAGRIFLGEMLRLSAIYRAAEKSAEGGGAYGADSLLGDRPTKYKRADVVAGIRQSREDFKKQGGIGGSLKRDFLPLIPRDDFSPQIAAKIREGKGVKAPVKLTPAQQAEQAKLLDEARRAARAVPVEDSSKLLDEARRAAGLTP